MDDETKGIKKLAMSTVTITDRILLQAYKQTVGFRTEADFARWLGVSRQRLNLWLNGTNRVSDLWIIQNVNDQAAAPLLRELAGKLMQVHAAKARMN